MNHSKLLSAPQLRQPRKGDLPAVKGSRQGPGNRDLLGHALSQSKQGASDHRPVQAAGLEPTAGPHAMHAFDPVSGGELTPMSTGPAPGFSAGPVQAKKRRTHQPGKSRALPGLGFWSGYGGTGAYHAGYGTVPGQYGHSPVKRRGSDGHRSGTGLFTKQRLLR